MNQILPLWTILPKILMFTAVTGTVQKGKSFGGGVLIAVDHSITSLRRSDIETVDESVWVELCGQGKRNILLSTFYFSPNLHPHEYESGISAIENVVTLNPCHDFCIAGDFNAPGIDWLDGTVQHQYHYAIRKGICLLYFISFTDLQQKNDVKHCNGNTLDLCFSNLHSLSVSKSDFHLVCPDKYHPPLHLSLPCSSQFIRSCPSARPAFNFAAGDYVGFYNYLSEFDWSEVLNAGKVEEQVEQFSSIMQEGMRRFIPRKRPRNSKFPAWFSGELRVALKHKKRAHRKARRTNSESWQQQFFYYRSLCKVLLKRDRLLYISAVENDATRSSRCFWQYVRFRSVTKSREDISLLDEKGNNIASVADAFSEHFSSVFGPNTLSRARELSSSNFCFTLISEEDVHKALKQLKPSLSSGLDEIPSALLKAYGVILAPILTSIFNNCINSSTFPRLWKVARIVPVFKSGVKTMVENYRPISILCSASKLFESILDVILPSSVKNILLPEQHGFSSRRSTTTNLVSFMSFASEAVHGLGQLDTVYCDLSKSFDVVDHSFLRQKMSTYNIPVCFVELLSSYLNNRSCFVSGNDKESAAYYASSGVPQGSVLGPLLFSLFVNDVSASINHSCFLLYADDIKVFKEVTSAEDCIVLESDVDAFSNWCSANKLALSGTKTKVMSYTRKTNPILYPYVVKSVPLLRVCKISELEWYLTVR